MRSMFLAAGVCVFLGCGGGSRSTSPGSVAGDDTDAGGSPRPDAGVVADAAPEAAGDGACIGAVPLTYQATTDRAPHQASPPALGPAGTIVKDPVYGTSILRVTDASTTTSTTSFKVANEFWGNDWSLDSKLFYAEASTGGFLPFAFDPIKLVASRVQDVTKPGTPLGMPVFGGGFSRTEPTVLYGLTGLSIERFDFATQTKTLVVDLTAVVPGATGYALGVQQGKTGLLVTSFGGPQQDKMPYVATYDPATQTQHVVDVTQSTLDGKPVGATIGGGVHTFKIDASGRFIAFAVNGAATTDWLWDTQAGTVTAGGPGGGSLGWASWLGNGKADSYDWQVSTFASPQMPTSLVAPLLAPADKLASWNHSWESSVAGPSTPAIVETMRQPSDTGPWRAWDEEVLALRTDGAESTIWRFAHTFNTYSGTTYSDAYYYLFIPRESQNGWFVLFDSNWNGTLGTDASGNPRTDAFIVALPNPCGP